MASAFKLVTNEGLPLTPLVEVSEAEEKVGVGEGEIPSSSDPISQAGPPGRFWLSKSLKKARLGSLTKQIPASLAAVSFEAK